MEIKIVTIEKPEDTNFILGQSHFIKTVEDLYEAMVSTVRRKIWVGVFANPRSPPVWFAIPAQMKSSLIWRKKMPINCLPDIVYSVYERYFPDQCAECGEKRVWEVCGFFVQPPIRCRSSSRKLTRDEGVQGVIDGFASKELKRMKIFRLARNFCENSVINNQ